MGRSALSPSRAQPPPGSTLPPNAAGPHPPHARTSSASPPPVLNRPAPSSSAAARPVCCKTFRLQQIDTSYTATCRFKSITCIASARCFILGQEPFAPFLLAALLPSQEHFASMSPAQIGRVSQFPYRLPWSAPAAAVRRQWLSASPSAAPSPKRRAPDAPTADYRRSPERRAAVAHRPSARAAEPEDLDSESPSGRLPDRRPASARLATASSPRVLDVQTPELPKTRSCCLPGACLAELVLCTCVVVQYSENQSNASSNDSLFWTLVMF
ncbi:hypothetical protein GUJ93_ZPchr0006g43750 [Zizania palustris]|uniref:Uncharacterized protein n=1 Tax=Zizania palustris TaxID=103762 RepID=A0A8J5SDT6_ZIZPA|nr:hypothetical protein GUJ93_ZPchr0006g43750 [Zizania palustris]